MATVMLEPDHHRRGQMNHRETRQREMMRRRAQQARHLEQKRQLHHHDDKPKERTMTMRSWKKLQEQKVMASHGTEDIAGRLPGDAYNLPGMHRPKPPPIPKAKLRAEAA